MCIKDKSTAKEKPGRFKCKRCGAVSKKKSDICKPKKIKKIKKTKKTKNSKKKEA